MKRYLHTDVLTAARERIDEVFRSFARVYVSFSGGKDSGVLLNLALEAARRHDRLPLEVLFIDMEAQYKRTIDYCSAMMLRPEIQPYWVCLPIHLRNAVSQFQPHWLCWDEDRRADWCRPLPLHAISDPPYFPFFRRGMEFEEFTPAFGKWMARDGIPTACLVGIRTDESLNRFRTIRSDTKEMFEGWQWSTRIGERLYNFYPIYDWRTEDIWTANAEGGWSYNTIYDLMHLAGLSIHQMRLCQPYGDDQRKGLHLFKLLEPEMWAKVVQRVDGANFGNRYSGDSILGNFRITLPDGHTFKSYARFLLSSMPPHLERHYRGKIFKFLCWWRKHRREFNLTHIPDFADARLEAKRALPSWRRICKVLLKNDYWCKGLSFSQTKREMERQLALVAKYMEF